MHLPEVYLRSFIEQLFSSPRCLLCQLPSQRAIPLCHGCENDLPWLNHHCQQCAEPLPDQLVIGSDNTPICGRCLNTPPAFNHTIAPLLYQFPINRLIQQLKQRADIHAVELLSRLFIQRLSGQSLYQQPGQRPDEAYPLPQQLIPVPLHRNRLYQRGFNQSRELAHAIGSTLQIPVNDHACQRLLDTPHQQGLTAKQRRRNLRHAFDVDATQLQLSAGIDHVSLIDDVMTTGSTAQILAQQLHRAGVSQIDIWCLARTPKGRTFIVKDDSSPR